MPAPGTLGAQKTLFSALQTVIGTTTLTSADIGRTILVDVGGAEVLNMPPIPGVPPSSAGAGDGESAVGAGATFLVILVGAGSVAITFPVPARPGGAVADTFNGSQAGPINLTVQNEWAILVSNGAPTTPGDWAVLRGGA